MKLLIDRQFRIARIWSNHELRKLAPLFSGEVVNISAWDDRDKEGGHYRDYFSKASGYYCTNYRGTRGYQQREGEYLVDLTEPAPETLRRRFDVAFNHTTFEHIFDVRQAFRTFCDMTKDIAIVVVPFSQVQHETESYKDYWRFTPSCLHELFRENGLKVIYEAQSKHKNAATYLLFVASRHPDKWRDLVPKSERIEEAGRWIGSRWSFKKLRHRIRGLCS